MSTLLRNQKIVGGQLDLGRMSTMLDCSLSGVTVGAVEGDTQIVRSVFHGCDLRKVRADALEDCELVECQLPRGVDGGRNRVRVGPRGVPPTGSAGRR